MDSCEIIWLQFRYLKWPIWRLIWSFLYVKNLGLLADVPIMQLIQHLLKPLPEPNKADLTTVTTFPKNSDFDNQTEGTTWIT